MFSGRARSQRRCPLPAFLAAKSERWPESATECASGPRRPGGRRGTNPPPIERNYVHPPVEAKREARRGCGGCRASPSGALADARHHPPSTRRRARARQKIQSKEVPSHDVLIIGAGPGRTAGRAGGGPGGRVGRDRLQGPPGPLPLGRGGRRDQRGAEPRGQLGVARVRHRQGLRLPGRPGRDRDHVPGGARRDPVARARRRHVPPQRDRPPRHPRVRRRLARRARTTSPTSPATRSCTCSTSS